MRSSIARRRGSILIMVCSLLVLLALLGVAWLATARIDRYGSVQHVTNTQIDLLIEGVTRMAQGAVVDDLFGKPSGGGATYYRPRTDSATAYTYGHFDSIVPASDAALAGHDAFLAARCPEVVGGWAIWPAITSVVNTNGQFESPYMGTAAGPSWKYSARISTISLGGRVYPALELRNPATGQRQTLLAADADGDGIADAALWPLPSADLNGVRYYAAVRIIDNNSAINAAVAWKPNDESGNYAGFDNGSIPNSLPTDFFPTNVNLASLLSAAEMSSLNAWRFGDTTQSATPMNDANAARSDFAFVSPYDAMWTQLGRRTFAPGYNRPDVRYRALAGGDSAAMACRFVLGSSSGPSSTIELKAPGSLAPPRTTPYRASDVSTWIDDNFNYPTRYSRRAILTAQNAVSNALAATSMDGPANLTAPTGMAAYWTDAPPVKTSLNTAAFDELWRAFWSVMADRAGGGSFTTPFGPTDDPNPYINAAHPTHAQRMFRPSLRDRRSSTPGMNTMHFDPTNQLKLRAAIAAVNALDLRDGDRDVTHKRITLDALIDNAPVPVEVVIFGNEGQLYLTEVFANTDNVTPGGATNEPNPKGYVAVELHNPHSYPINLGNWRLGLTDRRATSPLPAQLRSITGFAGFGAPGAPGTPVVPPGGYVVLENYSAAPPPGDTSVAKYRPARIATLMGLLPPEAIIYVPNLHEVFEDPLDATRKGGELVLLRPRRADGTLSSSTAANDVYDEANIQDLAPVDSFDFTGVLLPSGAPLNAGNPACLVHYVRASGPGQLWKHVYPGRYDGTLARLRHEGTEQLDFVDAASEAALTPAVPVALGAGDAVASYPNPFLPIQVANQDHAGPNAATGATGNKFPFGGFARAGDVLGVPFIGAYRVRASTGNPGAMLYELNALTLDSAFADDADPADDVTENIGRMCPVGDPVSLPATGDYGSDPAAWRYRWAMGVFDCFTVLAPHDDYLPNVDRAKYPGASPDAVDANAGADRLRGVEGLVNLNTASVSVIAALPIAGTGSSVSNTDLARRIVDYRSANGPFRSLFDLNKVLGFREAWGDPATDPNDAQGDISPAGAAADGVRGDWEEQFLTINRISNMVTLRSDVFTCYVVIQGWRNAPSAAPQLVAERKAAFIVDRTNVTNRNRSPRIYTLATD